MCEWKSSYSHSRSRECFLGFLLILAGLTGWETYAAEFSHTEITANMMTAHSTERKAVFEGEVILKQGDLIVHSDVMVVFFKPTESAASNQSEGESETQERKVDFIEATGSVVIKKGDGKATCRRAIYYKDEEKIVLTGSPVAFQRGTRVTGQKMTMYLNEDRSVVEGRSRAEIREEES